MKGDFVMDLLKKLFSIGNIIYIGIFYFLMKWFFGFLDPEMSIWWVIPMGFAIKWWFDWAEEKGKKDKEKFDQFVKAKEDAEVEVLVKDLEKDIEIERNIVAFLKKEKAKFSSSDINIHLKIGDKNRVKKLCEALYRDKKINRTGNYRYFV